MNIKKVMHKDRHGAQVSVEFDSSGAANPQTLGVLQEFFKVAVPQMGGVPEQHPGQPKGTDTVPAWLTPGEFVMNAEATRMFEPQIKQMNDAGRAVQAAQGGTIPEYHAKGGEAGGPCWDGYEMVGMKQKGGKDVPNCVPEYKADGGPIPNYLAAGDYATWITPELLDSLRMVESGGDNSAISPAGAIGEYQWMPDSAANPGYGVDPFDPKDPEAARQATAQYLTGIQKAYGWGPEQTLQAYNMGPNALSQVLAGKRDMPEETVNYAGKVLGGVSGQTDAPPTYNESTGYPIVDNVLDNMYKVPSSNDLLVSKDVPEDTSWWSKLNVPAPAGVVVPNKPNSLIDTPEELEAKKKSLDKAYIEGSVFAPQTPEDLAIAKKNLEIDLNAREEVVTSAARREAQDKLDRAKAIGADKATIDKLQADVDSLSNKPKPKDQDDLKAVTINGVKVTAENINSFTPKLQQSVTQAGAKAAEDPGLFKSAMNWVDENFGGILNSDDLKKMLLYYLGSRAFGNSHEGSANWVGTMFVKDAQSREALVQKLAASGKYDEKSIEKYKQTRNLGDLKAKVAVSDIGDKTTYYVNGERKLLSKITLDNGTVYYEDEAGNQINRKNVRTASDYDREFDRISSQTKELAEGVYNTRYPKTGDNADKSLAMRAVLPPESVMSQALAQHLMEKEGGVANVDKVNLVNNVIADMEKDIIFAQESGRPIDFSSAAAVVPYFNAQTIRAKADEHFKGVSDVKRAELGNLIAKQTPSKMAPSAYISTVLDEAMKEWNDLDEKTRNQWNRKGDKERGTNGFYEWFLKSE